MKAYTAGMAVLAMVLATAMAAGTAFAGQTQAEREKALRQSADPESIVGWKASPPLETGKLPGVDARHMKAGSESAGGFSTVDIGGTVYRIGIDTY